MRRAKTATQYTFSLPPRFINAGSQRLPVKTQSTGAVELQEIDNLKDPKPEMT